MIVRILVIDPGKTSGYAIFTILTKKKKPKLVSSGCVPGDAGNNFRDMDAFVYNADVRVLIIETQFFHPKRKAKNLMQLLENRFTWEFFAKQNSCTIIRVDPAEWQNYWKLRPDTSIKSSYKRGKDFKRQIVEKAKKIARRRRMEENEADAILMGFYWIRSGGLREYINARQIS